ncbi:MAG: molybdopterin guanine dinucleotide-containing S/N-oxide reductase [Kiloniellales bacterium]
MDLTDLPLTSAHWGTYRVARDGNKIALHGFERDPDPSPIGPGILDVLDGPTRITAPMVRRGWLEKGPGSGEGRGSEPFVQVSWEEAEKLVADELDRVRSTHGNEAIYAGSYGWASAGRFHHAQGHLKRFLNCIGGHSFSRDTYSFAAAEVMLPHVLGGCREFIYPGTNWRTVIANTELFVAFGGIPLKNGQISQGGCGRHRQAQAMREAVAAGIDFVNISPLRDDVMAEAGAEWLAPRPSSDVAIILGLCHTLLVEELYDAAFLKTHAVGFEPFAAYLRGESDGIPKTAAWAAEISALPEDALINLARRMASSRTKLSFSWSLTRQDHGEQPLWAGVTLAAMLGQIGVPGGGFGFGFSAVNSVGNEFTVIPGAPFPQGRNPVKSFIPVSRIADMLLNPGAPFDYNGGRYNFPDIRLVFWAGGNPFHHHQDLNRLQQAWKRPESVIVNEWSWNALAKHADIVLPCTTHLEREDVALTPRDGFLVHMEKAVEPQGEARDDYGIFSGLAARMGVQEEFTEGREAKDWIRHLYERTQQACAEHEIEIPGYDEFCARRWFEVAPPREHQVLMRDFRLDPEANPLKTPSGKIEIYSETLAGFGYRDCPPHPTWMEPYEWLGNAESYPLHLISNQPTNKLHSQLDHGAVSRAGKIGGREPVMLHPSDAAARGIADGDVVRVFNDRGACYGGAEISDGIRPGVIRVSTGAWFDPEVPGEASACKHGNPNMLTRDKGTSSLAQGPTAHSCLVEVELAEEAPKVTAFDPPDILQRS